MRNALIDVLGDDFVQTARAKGVREKQVLWKHVVPNAMLPDLDDHAAVARVHLRRRDHDRVRVLLAGARPADGAGDRREGLPAAPGPVPPVLGGRDRREPRRRHPVHLPRPAGAGCLMRPTEAFGAPDAPPVGIELGPGPPPEPPKQRPSDHVGPKEHVRQADLADLPEEHDGDDRAGHPHLLHRRRDLRPLPRSEGGPRSHLPVQRSSAGPVAAVRGLSVRDRQLRPLDPDAHDLGVPHLAPRRAGGDAHRDGDRVTRRDRRRLLRPLARDAPDAADRLVPRDPVPAARDRPRVDPRASRCRSSSSSSA